MSAKVKHQIEARQYTLTTESKNMCDTTGYHSLTVLMNEVRRVKRFGLARKVTIKRDGYVLREISVNGGIDCKEPYSAVNIELMRIPKQDLLSCVVEEIYKAANYMACQDGIDAVLINKDSIAELRDKTTDSHIRQEYTGLLMYMRPHTYIMMYDEANYE